MTSIDELLKPSLSDAGSTPTPIYSTTAGFATAFFGGPFAAVALTAVNSGRLRRLAADAPMLLALAAVSLLIIAFCANPALFGQPDFRLGNVGMRLVGRGAGLGVFSVSWLMHRRYYRSMQVIGIEPPKGWIAGLACIVFGALSSLALIGLVAK